NGRSGTVTAIARNLGPDVAARPRMVVIFPPGMAPSPALGDWSTNQGTCVIDARIASCDFNTEFGPSDVWTVRFLRVSQTGPATGDITVTVSAAEFDPNTANNR